MKRRVVNYVLTRLYKPSIRIAGSSQLVRLGSVYGGWTIENTHDLHGTYLISAGLGEDASFDVEMAARFGATVIVVDPTPRAVQHFDATLKRVGMAATQGYVAGGNQPVEAYDLATVKEHQLTIVPMALWVSEEPVRFHRPENTAHVSHSIKFASSDKNDNFIVVPTVLIGKLLDDAPSESNIMLKMDIEGAEIEILESIRDWPRLPAQLLIEFDVLRRPGAASKQEVERIDRLLVSHGYSCKHFDGDRNYLYVR